MAKRKRSDVDRKGHAHRVVDALKREYPETACALVHADPYQLLVATILSAQCTDARVNMVTPELFRRYPDAPRLAKAVPSDERIKDVGDKVGTVFAAGPDGEKPLPIYEFAYKDDPASTRHVGPMAPSV